MAQNHVAHAWWISVSTRLPADHTNWCEWVGSEWEVFVMIKTHDAYMTLSEEGSEDPNQASYLDRIIRERRHRDHLLIFYIEASSLLA